MSFLRIKLFFIYILFAPFIVLGQNLKFEKYTTDDGLSQGTINCIWQDELGYLWFGTEDGLNRFDGNEFKIFLHNPADDNTISGNKINTLIGGPDGRMWIGTSVGLNFYDSKTGKISRWKNEDDIPGKAIVQDMDTYDGRVWIATQGNGVLIIGGKDLGYSNLADAFTDKSWYNKNIRAIEITKSGEVLIGTEKDGVYLLSSDFTRVDSFLVNTGDELWDNFNNRITDIYEDSRGRIWIGTESGGMNLIHRESGNIQCFGTKYYDSRGNLISKAQNRVRDIIEATDGKIWLATSGGLSFFDQQRNNYSTFLTSDHSDAYSLNFNDLYSLFIDNAGSMWVGTYGNGVNVYHPSKWKFSHYKMSESKSGRFKSNIIHGMTEKDGILYVATRSGGVFKFDRNKDTIVNFMEVPELKQVHHSVLSLHIDNEGILWLGTWGSGLQSVNLKSGIVKTFETQNSSIPSNTVLCIYEDGDDLWLGTFGGLVKFNKISEETTVYNSSSGFGSDRVYCIEEGGGDTLFVGCLYGGFNVFSKKNGIAESFLNNVKDPMSISSNSVVHICKTKEGQVWIGTETGLNQFHAGTNTFDKFYRSDGLPNDHIYAVVQDNQGDIWLSTNKGISVFNPSRVDGIAPVFRNYDVEDGLQGNEFNQCSFYKSNTGEIFFGGTNGFNSFYPENILVNKHTIPVRISSFKIFDNEFVSDTSIQFVNDISLSYRNNFIAIEFVGLDYVFPSKNKYSFILEGLDLDWSKPSTRKFASYPDLSPGNYVFRVKACNNDGVWNNLGCRLNIEIVPPFYRRTYFIISVILAGVFLIFLIFHIRTSRIKKEKRILEEKVKERTAELQQKNEDITSSIEYACRIQQALFKEHSAFSDLFPESFILLKPKDIVSGDFVWFWQKDNLKLFVAADCTGHGVPGAFMSIIGENLLQQVIVQSGVLETSKILIELNRNIRLALRQDGRDSDSFDGMDIALCIYDEDTGILNFSGAYRPLYHVSDGVLNKYDGTKFSIGGSWFDFKKEFKSESIQIKKGDAVYIFSDGYADQYGGPEHKKFKLKNFRELIYQISEKSMMEQKEILESTIEKWKNNSEQIDDILVIGVRFL